MNGIRFWEKISDGSVGRLFESTRACHVIQKVSDLFIILKPAQCPMNVIHRRNEKESKADITPFQQG